MYQERSFDGGSLKGKITFQLELSKNKLTGVWLSYLVYKMLIKALCITLRLVRVSKEIIAFVVFILA